MNIFQRIASEGGRETNWISGHTPKWMPSWASSMAGSALSPLGQLAGGDTTAQYYAQRQKGQSTTGARQSATGDLARSVALAALAYGGESAYGAYGAGGSGASGISTIPYADTGAGLGAPTAVGSGASGASGLTAPGVGAGVPGGFSIGGDTFNAGGDLTQAGQGGSTFSHLLSSPLARVGMMEIPGIFGSMFNKKPSIPSVNYGPSNINLAGVPQLGAPPPQQPPQTNPIYSQYFGNGY